MPSSLTILLLTDSQMILALAGKEGGQEEEDSSLPSIDDAEGMLDLAAQTQRMVSLCAAQTEVALGLTEVGDLRHRLPEGNARHEGMPAACSCHDLPPGYALAEQA